MTITAIGPLSVAPPSPPDISSIVPTPNSDGTVTITTTYVDGTTSVTTATDPNTVRNSSAQQWVNPGATTGTYPASSLIWLSV